jgi:hypothetical protein
MSEHLLLKWGTLKGWKVESDKSREALKRYFDSPVSMGAMQQKDTPEQKQALCDLIDAIDGEIQNDRSGEKLTKDDAKKYVMEYGHKPATTPATPEAGASVTASEQ